MQSGVSNIVLVELYRYIKELYDESIAEYVLELAEIKKEDLTSLELTYTKFCTILQSLHKLSGDKMICFNAGRDFQKRRFFNSLPLYGVRFSVKNTFYKLDSILEIFFPSIKFNITYRRPGLVMLDILAQNVSGLLDYFFSEYLRGIISSLPHFWDLPAAIVKVQSYPFNIDNILDILDVPYSKEKQSYLVYNQVIALEKEAPKDGKESHVESHVIQVVPDDLYVKDIFINRNTLLNAPSLRLRIHFQSRKLVASLIFLLLSLIGAGAGVLAYYFQLLPFFNIASLFLGYEAVLGLVFTLINHIKLKELYRKMGKGFAAELTEQRNAINQAINHAFTRLKSIENLVKITKKIIHERNIKGLIDTIRKLTAQALDAERATVFIHDRERRELFSPPELSEEKKEIRFPEDKGIAGQIVKLKKIVNVTDAYNNPYFNKAVDRKTGFHTKTILGSPLMDLEKNLVGIIQVLNKKDGKFERLDEQILETLSSYIAIALKDSLIIKNLKQQGINPEIVNGLSSILRHVFDKYKTIQNIIKDIESPTLNIINPMLEDLHQILDDLSFLFAREYQFSEKDIGINKYLDELTEYLKEKAGMTVIDYEKTLCLPEDFSIVLDKNLLKRATLTILDNSIEAIERKGIIRLNVYNYDEIPIRVIHDYSLQEAVAAYNRECQISCKSMIDFIKSSKPLLESELGQIEEKIKSYLVFEFFDSGTKIDDEARAQMFNPFYSTKNHFGLGLAIAKAAAKWMNGRIEEPIEQEDGKSIRVLIPLNHADILKA